MIVSAQAQGALADTSRKTAMDFASGFARVLFQNKTVMLLTFAALGVLGFQLFSALAAEKTPEPLAEREFEELYQKHAFKPSCAPLRVFHLGHSLVGRDMPAMLEQLAPKGHNHRSQLGWGTTLKAHWGPQKEIAGFASENKHPRFQNARDALASGGYDAFVMTEMVELRDAVRYFDSWRFLRNWAALARKGRPDIRIYLYETWHDLDVADGWLNRIEGDLSALWEGEILRRALAASPDIFPIHVIPAGQAMAAVARAMEAERIEGYSRREALFTRTADGKQDQIHPSDLGYYVVALTHYAVLYGSSPVGLPRSLRRHDGTPAEAPSAAAARAIQEIVWDVVSRLPRTGVTSQQAHCG
jgi:hypothetical protein